MKKIINIIVFVVAGLACLLAVLFSSSFQEDKREKYEATVYVNDLEPTMIADFEQLEVAKIPAYIDTYSANIEKRSEELKKIELQHDIFYTFIYQLEELINEELFNEYKAAFPEYSQKLFAKSDDKNYYKGFNDVKTFDQLPAYIAQLREQYAPIHQNYLVKEADIKNMNAFMKYVTEIESVVSAKKKEFDLNTFKTQVSDFTFEAKVINVAIILAYIIFFITFGSLVVFMLMSLVANIKGSMKVIAGVALIVLVYLLGYLFADSEKSVNGGIIAFYFVFFSAIIAIIATAIMGLIKKRR